MKWEIEDHNGYQEYESMKEKEASLYDDFVPVVEISERILEVPFLKVPMYLKKSLHGFD